MTKTPGNAENAVPGVLPEDAPIRRALFVGAGENAGHGDIVLYFTTIA